MHILNEQVFIEQKKHSILTSGYYSIANNKTHHKRIQTTYCE